MVAVQRLSLRLDNGTIVACSPKFGVTEAKQAVVIPYQEGFKKGFVSQVDLDRMGEYVAQLEARLGPKLEPAANKRKSLPVETPPPAAAKKQKTAPASTPPVARKPPAGNWLQQAIKVHQQIMTDPRSKIFREPVTVKIAPDYPSIIKDPMDLKLVRRKLNAQKYSAPQEFAADMDLIFQNCLTYNGKTGEYGTLGVQMNTEWQRQWAKTGLANGTESRSKRQTAGHAPTKWEPAVQQVSESRRSRGPSSKGGGVQREKSANLGRRNSVAQVQERPKMSDERIQLLGTELENMDENSMEGIMDILRTTAAYKDVEDDEIELDLEILTSAELWRLDDYVKDVTGLVYDPDAGGGGGAQPKQRGPVIENLSDEETDEDM